MIKSNTNNTIYNIYNQHLSNYKNRSILREYRTTFFNKFYEKPDLKGSEYPDLEIFNLINGTWLGGLGSGAWFSLKEVINEETYKIARYTVCGVKDFEGLFLLKNKKFNALENYKFVHPTNCIQVYIQQKNNLFCLMKIQ